MLQSGGVAWVGREGSAHHMGGSGITQVDGSKVGVSASSGLGRGDGLSISQLEAASTEGVKASQHVWRLMIATHQGPGEC